MGHVHIRIQDHVLGADSQFHPEVPQFPYNHQSYIHEPLTLMGYLDAITNIVQLVTGILILTQRQTTLVDKQGAEVYVLIGGRLRLGHRHRLESGGVRALGENRGRRSTEQIALIRMLWTLPAGGIGLPTPG